MPFLELAWSGLPAGILVAETALQIPVCSFCFCWGDQLLYMACLLLSSCFFLVSKCKREKK